MTSKTRVAGIDLGTTNSCVAVYEGKRARVLSNAEGSTTTPSVVSIDPDGLRHVGSAARHRAATHPESTVTGIKRIMGRRHDSAEALHYAEWSPLRLRVADDGFVRVEIEKKLYSPEEISAIILDQMRRTAEEALGEELQRAVVTVPAYFDDAQRHATRNAGRIAGLDVLRILNEPTAAALAYGLANERDGLVAIYDLGGGTFDVSILEIQQGVFQVRSTAGDSYLGGLDFDWKIAEWALDKFQKTHKLDLRSDKVRIQRVLDAAEETKKLLSSARHAPVSVPHIDKIDDGHTLHLDFVLSRGDYEGMCQPLVDKTIECCRQALEDAKLRTTDIDWIIFVGGQTRMPLVAQRVAEFFGRTPLKGINPDEVVAMGAAVMGGLLAGELQDVVLIDVAPHTLGIAVKGGRVHHLIPRNTPIPATAHHTFSAPAGKAGTIRLNVVQGESDSAAENRSIGTIELADLPPSDRDGPRIEVAFHIDANGIVEVTARDLFTGKAAERRIVDASFVGEDELSRMTHDMLTYRAADHRRRLMAEERNRAVAMLTQVRKMAKGEGPDSLWRDLLRQMSAELEQLLQITDAAAMDDIRRRLDAVSEQLAGMQ